MTKSLTLGVLFLTFVRTVLIAKLVILDISFLNSFILVLRAAAAAKLLILGILSSISLMLALYTSFLTTSFFTTLLSLLKSTETGTNLSTSNLFTVILKLFKPVGTFYNLSISCLSTSDFKLAQLYFLANFHVSAPAASFKSTFVAYLCKSSTFTFPPKYFSLEKRLFYQSNY